MCVPNKPPLSLENKLANLTKKVTTKQEIEKALNDKFHHHQHNAPGMSHNAKEMKKYATRVIEEAEEILQYTTMLNEMGDDQDAEINIYGLISE
jgi:hypothetical protein